MKKLLTLLTCVALLGFAGNAFATLDWAGNVWPLHGSNHVPTGDISVYAQVFKSGVTDPGGEGADISAVLTYTTEGGVVVNVPMVYHGDVGGNDEYTAAVAQVDLIGNTYVDATVVFTDESDGTTFEITGDQNQNPPPLRFNVIDQLPVDVTVRFTMCMSGQETLGDPCVIGSASEIGAWGTGVNMTNIGGELWQVDVVFAAGGNPSFEYKFKKDGCVDWEGVGNRLVDLPTDGTNFVELDIQSWNNLPLGCGLGTSLEEDKVVCIQVCLVGVENTGGVCVTGNQPEFTMWGDGAPMVQIAPGLYQQCFTYAAGTLIPVNLEFKFKKDGCQTWESVGNRLFAVDNSIAAETTLTYTWDDGPNGCDPVATENQTWGTLKGSYR